MREAKKVDDLLKDIGTQFSSTGSMLVIRMISGATIVADQHRPTAKENTQRRGNSGTYRERFNTFNAGYNGDMDCCEQ